MIFPEKITISFNERNTGVAIPDIAIKIKLFAHSHNDYYFLPQRSDIFGNIYIEKAWLKEEILKASALFIMDYKSSLEQCASKIEIHVLSDADIKNTLESLKDWIKILPDASTEMENLLGCKNSNYKSKYEIIDINEYGCTSFIISLDKF